MAWNKVSFDVYDASCVLDSVGFIGCDSVQQASKQSKGYCPELQCSFFASVPRLLPAQ